MSVADIQPPSWLDRWMSRIILAVVLGTMVCFAGLGYLQVQVRGQASQGAKARERQMRVYPVSQKLYVDAWRRGVITLAELQCFQGRDEKCPPVKRAP